MADPPSTAASFERLAILVEEFMGPLAGHLGRFARLTDGFYSYQVVTRALQRLRLDLINGAALTPRGARFAAGAAAFLATLAARSWQRRGLDVHAVVTYGSGDEEERISVGAFRQRDGNQERYVHDVFADLHEYLLRPPRLLPTLHGRSYILTSLTLPEPEYLYLYGLFLLYSAMAVGNWPKDERVGGRDEDFAASRNLLIDDLHADVGLPLDDEKLRALSWWVVFPPYGWDMNDGQEYNLMTLVDQIVFKRLLPLAAAEAYLRAILESQATHLRNLAARTLLVLGKGPATPTETIHYRGALYASDLRVVKPAMARFAWQAEGRAQDSTPPAEWIEKRHQDWQRMVDNGPTEAWRRSPLLRDPEYLAAAKPDLPREQQRTHLEALIAKHPGDWFLDTALGTLLMSGADTGQARRGEEILRRCVATNPDCATAHLSLGTHLKHQGRREEAMAIFEDAVRRWPWHNQAVDSCLWMVTDGMTAPPAAT
jgi:tetratricopeptide (TPR) repeat protein